MRPAARCVPSPGSRTPAGAWHPPLFAQERAVRRGGPCASRCSPASARGTQPATRQGPGGTRPMPATSSTSAGQAAPPDSTTGSASERARERRHSGWRSRCDEERQGGGAATRGANGYQVAVSRTARAGSTSDHSAASTPAIRNRASTNRCPGTSTRHQAEIEVGRSHRLQTIHCSALSSHGRSGKPGAVDTRVHPCGGPGWSPGSVRGAS